MNSQGCKCSAMAEEVLSGTSHFTSWMTDVDTQINSIRTDGVSGGSPSESEQRILKNTTSDLQVINDCLAKKTSCISNLGTTISGSQDQILSLKEQIAEEQAGIDIAVQRLSYVRNSNQHTSFYQSWFPLDRPLKLISIPILLGFVFFFLVMSLGILLSIFGISLGFGSGVATATTLPSQRSWSEYLFSSKSGVTTNSTNSSSIQQTYRQIQRDAQRKQLENQRAAAKWKPW